MQRRSCSECGRRFTFWLPWLVPLTLWYFVTLPFRWLGVATFEPGRLLHAIVTLPLRLFDLLIAAISGSVGQGARFIPWLLLLPFRLGELLIVGMFAAIAEALSQIQNHGDFLRRLALPLVYTLVLVAGVGAFAAYRAHNVGVSEDPNDVAKLELPEEVGESTDSYGVHVAATQNGPDLFVSFEPDRDPLFDAILRAETKRAATRNETSVEESQPDTTSSKPAVVSEPIDMPYRKIPLPLSN